MALAALTLAADADPLSLAARIELPGVEGRLDHLAVDHASGSLFIAALAANTVEVIDLRTKARVSRIPAQGEPQGAAFAASRQRLFVANGGGGSVQVFEGGRLVRTIKDLPDADNLRLRGDQLFVGYGHAIAVVDINTLAIVRRMALPGHPEAFELDDTRIYVNVPDSRAAVVLDPAIGKEVARWSVQSLEGNFPMALDAGGQRLFIATRRPAALIVIDTRTGRQAARQELCGDADDLFFDARRERLYAVCGQGEVDVIDAHPGAGLRVIQRMPTSSGARTGLFVAESNELLVAAPRRRQPAAVWVLRVD